VLAEGLAESRTRAQALITAGRVLVNDAVVDKVGTRIADEASLRVRGGGSSYVSRGGEKLAGALADLGLDPTGMFCLDIGASTGGFTDCLLQHGARGVLAVDVGYGQLHERMRQDPRVVSLERTNARELPAEAIAEPPDLVVIDVSFISVRLVLPRIAELAGDAQVLAMVKPQFEVGRNQVGRGGVVRDDGLRAEAAMAVAECGRELGYRAVGQVDSRVAGPKGNREIFLLMRRGGADAG
jgi:23S rRNA (cytidine1920-2'-O)/16S rRNA (cytidine1409-2'-O)-methyltransferase